MLSLVFGPDTVSTANMMTDLAHGLCARGHTVTVLTSMPHYNPSPEILGNPDYRARFPRLYTDVREQGVRVLRVYMPLKGQRVWRRALDYLWFQALTLIIGVIRLGQHDVIFVPSPPITLGINGYLLKVFLRGRMIYDVRELWPDAPIRMGLLKNKLIIASAYVIEKFVYDHSAAITSIALSFNNNLVSRGVPRGKLFFTPNFVDTDWLSPLPKSNGFAREQELEDKFVVFYAGNIGLSQGLEILVDVAQAFEADTDIVVLIIGDGAARPKLEQAIAHSRLQNIRLLPFQPYDRVPETYATADICVSPMQSGFSYDTVPSKIYTAMAAGRPVVAACESGTETADLLLGSGGGFVVEPESATQMIAAIRRLHDSSETARVMGAKARQWIVDRYSKNAVIAVYDQVIRRVAQS
jgi:colanic acid biosynthesis glycosyl transferase WcaI